MEFLGIKIIKTNGWDLEKEIPQYDYQCIENKLMIPYNYGRGIKMIYNNEIFTARSDSKPTVVLDITSWRGISMGALHYYGDLKIGYPKLIMDSRKTCSISSWNIPMFKRDKIHLTTILEQWEIDAHPENYDYLKAGAHYVGFHSVNLVISRAKEVINVIFDSKWKLKIEHNY